MSKQKSIYTCQQCGSQFPKWSGQCSGCGEWNSLVEELVRPRSGKWSRARPGPASYRAQTQPKRLDQIKQSFYPRLSTDSQEFDRVLGGGIVAGSVILVSGEPGIGKSTLLLQIAASGEFSPLYISGEESEAQLKLRADRLGLKTDRLLVYAETDVDLILETMADQAGKEGQKPKTQKKPERSIAKNKPLVTFVDSIQTIESTELAGTPGSVGQVRACASRLHRLAKSLDCPLFLVGQVTKEGSIAGPRVLEHLVDAVLYLEGDRFQEVRLLRSMKNRFGPTDEVGVFRMSDQGLEDVPNPSKMFLTETTQDTPGSVVVPTIEGTRPILVEIQALTVPSKFVASRRVTTGLKYDRVQFLTAVLQKRVGLPLDSQDVYVNAVGGLRIDEPAADLGICLAIYSSLKNLPLPKATVVLGEVGLLGEIRPVAQLNKRVKEAQKLGYQQVISPENVRTLAEAVQKAFAAKKK